MDGLPTAWEVDGSSRKVPLSHRKLKEHLPDGRKVDGKSPSRLEISRKLTEGLLAHGKLMEGLPTHEKLTEGLLAAQKIDSVYWPHGNLTEIDRRFPGPQKVDGRSPSSTES